MDIRTCPLVPVSRHLLLYPMNTTSSSCPTRLYDAMIIIKQIKRKHCNSPCLISQGVQCLIGCTEFCVCRMNTYIFSTIFFPTHDTLYYIILYHIILLFSLYFPRCVDETLFRRSLYNMKHTKHKET